MNIAAVNYHFGRTGHLVNEVFPAPHGQNERAAPQALKVYAQRPGQLEPVLAAFVEPRWPWPRTATAVAPSSGSSPAPYAESNEGLRKFLSEQYGHVLREFAKAIDACVPGLGRRSSTAAWTSSRAR